MFAVMVLKGALDKKKRSLQQTILCSTQQSAERGQTSPLGVEQEEEENIKKETLASEEVLSVTRSSHETLIVSSQGDKY